MRSYQECKAIYDILAKLRRNGAKCEGPDATVDEIFALGTRVANDDALWDALPDMLETRVEGYMLYKFDLRQQLLDITRAR